MEICGGGGLFNDNGTGEVGKKNGGVRNTVSLDLGCRSHGSVRR